MRELEWLAVSTSSLLRHPGPLHTHIFSPILTTRCPHLGSSSVANPNWFHVGSQVSYCRHITHLPTTISDLKSLTELDLFQCQGLLALPPEIGGCVSLKARCYPVRAS